MPMQRIAIIVIFVCLAVAILWPLLRRLGLGKLPGDIDVVKNDRRFYFPITTTIIISVIITVVFFILRR